MKLNKRLLSFIGAILILLFHVWTTISDSELERGLITIFFVGVDIFFFISAYSLADKEVRYGSFLLNRLIHVYLKFVLFAVVFTIYKQYDFIYFLKTISGIALFEKGGGSFLWFGPAIMIFYILYPWFTKWSFKLKGILVAVLWLGIGVLVTYLTGYRAMFIFFNRIPVILIGYYAKKIRINIPSYLGLILLPIGLVVLYFLGYKYPLNDPVAELYYLSGIPFVLGLALASNYVKENKAINVLSSFTFELYGIQVIFTYALVNALLGSIGSILLCNLLCILIFLAGGLLIHLVFKYSEKGIQKIIATKSN